MKKSGDTIDAIGSIIYDHLRTKNMVLEFFTLDDIAHKEEARLPSLKPQRPLAENWILDFPLLAYSPENRKICISNVA